MKGCATFVLAAVAATCAAGCSSDDPTPTQVIVLVNAEADVRAALTEVRLLVEDSDNADALDEVLTPEDWPIKLALAPKNGDAGRTYTVTAQGFDDAGRMLAQARLASGYVEGEKRFVVLLLEDACLRIFCERTSDTCHAGGCVLATVRPEQLGTVRAEAPDIGRLLEDADAGTGDAGSDSGEGPSGDGGVGGDGGASGAAGDGGAPPLEPCNEAEGECDADCGAPAAPDNGSVSAASGTGYGATATHTCDDGYALSGAERTCQGDGSWSGSQPTCVDFDACAEGPACTADFPCRDLPAPSRDYSCRGQFAEWIPSDSPASFTTPGDGTVIDERSGLVWQESVDNSMYDWDAAKTYCNDLRLPGHSDWRLPARAELESLVDFTQFAPSIDGAVFPGTPDDWFWSSSPYVGDAGNAWTVVFDNGNSFYIETARRNFVRCVHGADDVTESGGFGGAPPGRYSVRSDGTVEDRRTGLTWQRVADTASMSQAEAASHCADLTLAGGDWRLPTISELLTIVDPTRTYPSIDRIAFPGTPTEVFWSSTAHASVPGEAWNVYFYYGYSSSVDATTPGLARCVR